MPVDRKRTTEQLTHAAIDWAVCRRKLGITREISVTFGRKRLRVDLLGVGYRSLQFTGFEVKSCAADFTADKKMFQYAKHLDRAYLVMTKVFYQSAAGKRAVEKVRTEGWGVLVLSDNGYCSVRHRAKRLPGLPQKERLELVSKILWKSAQINKANHPRRTRRFLE